MRDLAPDILRQRLLIEGYFTTQVDRLAVEAYLTGIATELALRAYDAPIVHDPGGIGKPENQGYDAFIPLIDSGISLYVWTEARFLACVAFTCKAFDSDRAVEFTSSFFRMGDIAWQAF